MTPQETPPLAFDPGALVERPDGAAELGEATLERNERGRLVLTVMGDAGDWICTVTLRAEFLDELLAQARAREVDAA